jgi:CRP-like cAMP-binding protein
MLVETANLLLASLSTKSRRSLLVHCVELPLPVRTSLYKAGEPLAFAYFITTGMASVVATSKDGRSAEVAVIGNEGIVGSLHLLGPAPVTTESFIQLAATGLRIPLNSLRRAFRASEEIRDRILECVQEQALTGSQISGCNLMHGAEARLARWLLMAQDRTQSDILEFTQEFLAMMLGAQRTTVTLIAGQLQRGGLIEYARGRVKIVNRNGLTRVACDCYPITRNLHDNLFQSKRRGTR